MASDATDRSGMTTWRSDLWRMAAVSWLDARLTEAGIERTGEVSQPHVRPWASVLRASTDHGPVWLKAAGRGTAFEAGLYQILHEVAPDQVLEPIAVDAERGWILLPDGGPTLGDRYTGAQLLNRLEVAVQQYAHLQRRLAPQVDDLLGAGVSDMRAAVMPDRLDQAVEAVVRHADQLGDDAQHAAIRRLSSFRPVYAAWCEQLAAAPVAASLDHNDLHPWNILLPDDEPRARMRFYDWGDSVVAHPFASMLVTLGFLRSQLGFDEDDTVVARVRDAYLEVFTDLAAHRELVAMLELACRVAKVARALTWSRAVAQLDTEEAREFAAAPVQCLVSLREASYLGAP